MNVQYIDNTFQYPVTDPDKIYKTREELDYKARTLSGIYLPVLGEQLNDLTKEIAATDAQALRTITLVPTILQSKEIQHYSTVIATLLLSTPTAEQKAAIDSFSAEIKTLIDDAILSTRKFSKDLSDSLTNLKAVTLSDNSFRISELQQALDAATLQLPGENSAIEQLLRNEAELNEAIKVIEATDTFTVLKELLLTVEQLTNTNMAAPKVALVQAGIKAAARVLGLIENTIKYDTLIAARREVQKRLDARRSNLLRINEDIKTLHGRKTQLTELQTVPISRNAYALEINTLVDSINKFLDITHFNAPGDLNELVKAFVEHSNVYSKHLTDLRKAWRS